jgi:LysM repeat protein
VLARRRAVAIGLAGVVAVVLLALPRRALGAVTVDGRVTPGAAAGGLAPGSTYVVHAGDTVASIAASVQGGNVAQVERQIVREVGSSVLVPGEHVVVP